MEEKLYTLSDMRAAFIAGEAFESDTLALEMEMSDAVQAPDFGNWMKENFEVEV